MTAEIIVKGLVFMDDDQYQDDEEKRAKKINKIMCRLINYFTTYEIIDEK